MKKFLLVLSMLFFISVLYANNLPYSQDISVKNAGAAGSLSVFINDTFSSFINPSLLGWTQRQNIGLIYYNLFEDGILSCGSYALPMIEKGTIGVTVLYLSSGKILERDINNQETGNVFYDTTTHISLAYGINLFSLFNIGLNAKYIIKNLLNNQYSGFGMDFGTSFELPYNIRVSANFENIIKPEFKYSDVYYDTIPLRFDLSAGTAIEVINSINGLLKLGVGIGKEEENDDIFWQAGAEYEMFKTIALRGGISYSGFAFGTSFSYFDFVFDYAFISKPVDFIHRFSLFYNFGDNIREIEEKTKTKEEKVKYELVQKIRQEALDEFKKTIQDALGKNDLDLAKETVVKALVWAPYDNWFKDKEREINDLINKDKKQKLLKEADTLLKQGSYIDALVSLKAVSEIEPENKEIQDKISNATEYVKKIGEKNIEVEEQNKEKIKRYFEKGLDLYTTGKYEKAIEEWNKVIQSSPLQNQVYTYIKKAEEKVRKKEEQTKTMKILEKQRILELYNEAVMAHTKGKFEESIKLWKEILKLDPNNKEAQDYLNKVTEEYKKIQQQQLQW